MSCSKNATKRTFGSLLTEMPKADVFETELATRLKQVLEERNRLVHRSVSQVRPADSDDASGLRHFPARQQGHGSGDNSSNWVF